MARASLIVTAGAAVVVGFASSARAQSIYETYSDWLGWARLGFGVHAGLASSYDRSDGNLDFSQYEYPEGLVLGGGVTATVKTIEGPGAVTRFWMPHYSANRVFVVRMFFDGEPTPRIDTTSDVLLSGGFAYFDAPLVQTFASGQTCYELIPFAKSLRIETVNHTLPETGCSSERHYYQYSFVTHAPDAQILSYDGTLTPEHQAARGEVAGMFENVGQHPAGASAGSVLVVTPPRFIPAGDSLSLHAGQGPGIVRRVNLRMDSATDDQLDGLRLIVTYDAEPAPAIDMTVSQFFGAGHLRADYASLPIGTDSPDGFYSYWPMPFRHAVSIELANDTLEAITIGSAIVEYESTSVGRDLCYLRASAHTHVRQGGDLYHPMLAMTGRGHYVGNFLFAQQSDYSFYMLEGDDVITVDGQDVLYGTGIEDAYNGGYYYNWVAEQLDEPEGPRPQSATRPLNGILYVQREEGIPYARADQYRWYIADRIPFCNSIDVKIENRYAVVGAEWTSVAFVYQLPDIEVPGDMDNDTRVDIVDLDIFVQVLLGDDTDVEHRVVADMNADCSVDGLDIQPFVDAMTAP